MNLFFSHNYPTNQAVTWSGMIFAEERRRVQGNSVCCFARGCFYLYHICSRRNRICKKIWFLFFLSCYRHEVNPELLLIKKNVAYET
jgi:hypothetical protein